MGENRGRNGEKSRDSVLNRFLRSEGRSEGVGGWNWLLTGWKRTRSISCAFWPVDARERVAISRRLFFSGRGRKGVEVGDPLETVENLIDRKRGWDIGWKIGFDRWPRTNATYTSRVQLHIRDGVFPPPSLFRGVVVADFTSLVSIMTIKLVESRDSPSSLLWSINRILGRDNAVWMFPPSRGGTFEKRNKGEEEKEKKKSSFDSFSFWKETSHYWKARSFVRFLPLLLLSMEGGD